MNKKLQTSPYIPIAVDINIRWPVAKITINTNNETVITFLTEFTIVYGVLNRETSDSSGASISKEYEEFYLSQSINCEYDTGNLHTGTGFSQTKTQSMKNLVLGNLENDTNLRESVNRALHVLRFTTHFETKN